jgi:hypothetical protein
LTTIAGTTDPQINSWHEVGVALASENTKHSEEAQGVTTDGHHWYLCSNNTRSVVKFDDDAHTVLEISPSPAIA